MAVHNGAENLPDQLASIKEQSLGNWRLIAGDDKSTDASRAVLNEFARMSSAEVVEGPGKGFVANFFSLLSLPGLQGPVALSDQDDIWFPDKLERGLRALDEIDDQRPALYCCRRVNWWPRFNRRKPSRTFPAAPSFKNALVENIAAGNTIILNDAALRLVRSTLAAARDVPFHDWWLYLVISGAGGQVICDPKPSLLYRQHEDNLVGQGEGFLASLKVKRGVWDGSYSQRIDRNIAALLRIKDVLTAENRDCLHDFAAARNGDFTTRLSLMRKSGVYRQGLISRIGFWGAVCVAKV
ncbi:glycosyltransferase [Thioclava sp. FR2]|uniref:glycosyltransferase n=1 Tax=Thioclava sp. FR2 TaxID=3445780 RepID=UPI003EB6D0EB